MDVEVPLHVAGYHVEWPNYISTYWSDPGHISSFERHQLHPQTLVEADSEQKYLVVRKMLFVTLSTRVDGLDIERGGEVGGMSEKIARIPIPIRRGGSAKTSLEHTKRQRTQFVSLLEYSLSGGRWNAFTPEVSCTQGAQGQKDWI